MFGFCSEKVRFRTEKVGFCTENVWILQETAMESAQKQVEWTKERSIREQVAICIKIEEFH